jgi:hypothetical protein
VADFSRKPLGFLPSLSQEINTNFRKMQAEQEKKHTKKKHECKAFSCLHSSLSVAECAYRGKSLAEILVVGRHSRVARRPMGSKDVLLLAAAAVLFPKRGTATAGRRAVLQEGTEIQPAVATTTVSAAEKPIILLIALGVAHALVSAALGEVRATHARMENSAVF